jgi:hypothetical protein
VLGLGLAVQTMPIRYAVLAFVSVLPAAIALVARWFAIRPPRFPPRSSVR